MAVLTTKARKGLVSAQFGLPRERKYPIEDASHAANAKARAAQMLKAGKLTSSQTQQIDAKANRVLGKSRGSK